MTEKREREIEREREKRCCCWHINTCPSSDATHHSPCFLHLAHFLLPPVFSLQFAVSKWGWGGGEEGCLF